MPRRNYYRPQPDYSHLLGVTMDVVLDAAIARRGYGQDRKHYPAEVNLALLKLYGVDRDWIAYSALRQCADVARGPRGWSGEFALDYVGNLIGWGTHLGILEESVGPGGEPGYRLLDREPVYEIIAGKAVRVRGLPAAEQVAMNVRRSRVMRLRATLARKRAAETRRQAAPLIDLLIEADLDGPIPDELHRFLGAFLVDLASDVTLREVRELLLDAYTEWSDAKQKEWVVSLRLIVPTVSIEAARRKAEEQVIAPEDLAAFADI
ncbi:hypothetical protein MKK55_18020 [Methylobacterium sp. J-059]|uniref:hypothetical protein n=1 Tax=Methylobacterium sp. J-059 TaxID=2836643 RepID=UPI001FB995B2|nr:hypothetical protein [Methylobacterium sp. J-059]MCJ2040830.1 hypothetical protein [Methylobacterium sp. J-059]